MADRAVHYEAAFEAFLRHRGAAYVAVDEAKKAMLADGKLKSFDFVVYSRSGPNLLADVKGRSMRSAAGRVPSMQTWATEEDVADLLQWQQVFGEGFKAVLVFAYWVDPPLYPEPDHFEHLDKWYRLWAVDVEQYQANMRRRSAKWQTVALPTAVFRTLARPVCDWL